MNMAHDGSGSGRSKRVIPSLLVGKIALSAASVLIFALLALPMARPISASMMRRHVRAHMGKDADVSLCTVVDAPFLFALNPRHKDINSFGLRDDECCASKPEGVFRILVLGDSVAFGNGVGRDEAFPNRLEQLLQSTRGPCEVLNAGVCGYTAYNELQYYLHRGRDFHPDLVIVAFCLNDVADPRLHWDYTSRSITNIPAAAIPNLQYDREHILPILNSRWHKPAHEPDLRAKVPTFITGEDSIDIRVLEDDSTPEWRWLITIYSKLRQAVARDGARFAIVLFPLAYQLDSAYPYLPQQRLAAYFNACGAPCLDLLPELRAARSEQPFMLSLSGYYDVWHLSPQGHQTAAEAIARFLETRHLL